MHFSLEIYFTWMAGVPVLLRVLQGGAGLMDFNELDWHPDYQWGITMSLLLGNMYIQISAFKWLEVFNIK